MYRHLYNQYLEIQKTRKSVRIMAKILLNAFREHAILPKVSTEYIKEDMKHTIDVPVPDWLSTKTEGNKQND